MGRAPNAVTSRVYCIARSALKAGGGALSPAAFAVTAGTLAAGVLIAASAGFDFVQAASPASAIKTNNALFRPICLLRLARFALLRMHQVRDPNAQDIQRHHGSR